MKWFRHTLRRSRSFVLTLLAVSTYAMVDGNTYVYAYQAHRQDEARLEEISERLGIPVEDLRAEREGPLVALGRALGIEPADPVAAAGRARLAAVLAEHEAKVAANPYRPRIEAVKREHALFRIEAAVHDLVELTEPAGELPEGSRRALMRNLAAAVRERPELPPLPEGASAKAEARHAAMQAKLDRLFESVAPVAAGALRPPSEATAAAGEDDFGRRVEQLRVFQTVEAARAERGAGPRFAERPLPLRRVERRAERRQVGSLPAARPSSALAPAPARAASSRSGAGGPRAVGAQAVAPEIAELAHALGDSPAQIFAWVHDRVGFDPKWGAVKGPLGALWEGSGTPWDQAWLLKDLLTAAGVDARFEWGEVEIPTAVLTNVTGLDDPFRAGDYLATAGVPTTLLVQGSQVIAARIDHVWVKAHLDYIPNRGALPGPGDTWLRLDPSLKRYDYAPGIKIHDQVPFSLGGYLLSGTELSPRRFYEEALWAHIRATGIECTTLEQLKRAGRPVAESFPFVPGTLRGKVLAVAGETADAPPAGLQQELRIEVRTAGGSPLVNWTAPWPGLYGERVEVAWPGATPDDQATLDAHGGVFETPPFLVDLRPSIRVAGTEVASAGAIGSAEDVEIFVTTTPVEGAATAVSHDAFAGERHVLALDFGRVPQQAIDAHRLALAAATAAGDVDAEEAETLFLLGHQYMRDLGRDLEDLAGWKWQRLIGFGTEAMVSQGGNVTTTVGGSPISFTKAERFVDVATMPLAVFPADGVPGFTREAFELLGSQSSYLEGEVFNQVLEREGIAAVTALTLAQRQGQTLTEVDGGNVGAVLAAVDLGAEVEAEIQSAVGQGKIAWVPEAAVTLNLWTGVGYVIEDPANGAAGYLLSGALAGGADTGVSASVLEGLLGSEAWLSGSPLGELLRAILAAFGGSGNDPGGDSPSTNHGDPVNLASGNFWLADNDYVIQARVLPIVWTRVYNSRSAFAGPLGHGWTFNYGEHIEEAPDGSVVYREGDGTEHVFESDGLGGYVRPAGKHLLLSKGATEFTMRATDGLTSTFDLTGRLLSVEEPNGNAVTLAYDSSARLETVTDATGRAVLNVAWANDRIVRVEDLTGRTITYSYDGDDLVSAVDTAGRIWTYAYDLDHNLISRTDPLGATHTYQYDLLDRCIGHVDPLGNEERFAYPTAGGSAVVTDARGFATFYGFDERGRATLRVDPLGNPISSSWDDDNNRLLTEDARGSTSRSFDGNGNLLSETDPLGAVTSYAYDPVYHQVQSVIDPLGHQVTQAFDASGNLVERSQTVGGAIVREQFDYDEFGRIASLTDANGGTNTFSYSASSGAIATQTDALGNALAFTTDSLGRVTRVQGPLADSLDVSWDDRDLVTSITDSFGNTSILGYDAVGRQTSVTTSVGTTTTVYDATGRVIARVDPVGNETRSEYDPVGNETARIDEKGQRIEISYDALGRALALVDAAGGLWSYEYCAAVGGVAPAVGGDPAGSFCTLTDPLGQTVRQDFDPLGRVIRFTDSLNNRYETTYDLSGRQIAAEDPLGRVTSFERDELGRLSAVVPADASRTEYSYDANGNLINVHDAAGRSWSRTYDLLDRLISVTDPLGGTRQFSYDALGNLDNEITPDGGVIDYVYDRRRLAEVRLPGGRLEQFGYDSLGRLIASSNDEGSTLYEFDALGRETRKVDVSLSKVVEYGYDPNGNITSITGPNGVSGFGYDSFNRLVEQNDPVTGIYRYEYDAVGRRTLMVYPNGFETEYSYDAAGRIELVVTRDSSGVVVDGFTYEYDASGNRTGMTLLHETVAHSYSYDDLNRLLRWERSDDRFEEYLYDEVGNRVQLTDELGSTSYTYDPANRLETQVRVPSSGGGATTSFTWDASGNLTVKSAPEGVTTYQWDANHRLLSVDGPGGTASYGYDPAGIRVRETVDGQTSRFLHAREDVIGIYDAAGVQTTYFAHGPGIDEPIAQNTTAGLHYIHRDALGSVTLLTSPEGMVEGSRQFAAFGAVESAAGAMSRYGFTSREIDASGLMYYRARYYDPSSGRFISPDAFAGIVSDPSSLNSYTYVQNSPVQFIDPSGHFQMLPALGMWTAVALASAALIDILMSEYRSVGGRGFIPRLEPGRSQYYYWSRFSRIVPAIVLFGLGVDLYNVWTDDGLDFVEKWVKSLLLILTTGLLYIIGGRVAANKFIHNPMELLRSWGGRAFLAFVVIGLYALYSILLWLITVIAFDEWRTRLHYVPRS